MIEFDSFLYGLAIACPLHNCDKSCPIDKIRELTIKERLSYIEELSKEKKKELLESHNACIERFEKKYFHTKAK